MKLDWFVKLLLLLIVGLRAFSSFARTFSVCLSPRSRSMAGRSMLSLVTPCCANRTGQDRCMER